MRASTILALVACAASPAAAAPKTKAARAEFDKGVSAYQKHNYTAASAALARSYGLEADTETLFAWAQSERQLGNCAKAIELYEQLLARELPSENASAVRAKRDECTAILAAAQPKKDPDPPPAKKDPEPAKDPKPDRVADAHPPIPERPAKPAKRAWWKDPLGGVLVVGGVAGLATGGVFLMQGQQAESDAKAADNLADFNRLDERARSRGKLGVIVAASGGGLVLLGILRYATRGGGGESTSRTTTVTGYLDGTSGGLIAFGRF